MHQKCQLPQICSTNFQVAIDAGIRLVIATGDPRPGNRDDCAVHLDSGIAEQLASRPVMADGGYQGNPGVIMPYRTPRDGGERPDGRTTSAKSTTRSAPAWSMPWPG